MNTVNFVELLAQKLSLKDDAKKAITEALKTVTDLPLADDAFDKCYSEFEGKNNTNLRAHYAKEVYDAVDTTIAPILSKLGADDKTVGGIKKLKLDAKFAIIEELFKSKIEEQSKPEDNSKGEDKTKELFEQIKKLQDEKAAIEAKNTATESEFLAKLSKIKQDAALSRLVNQYSIDKTKYPNDSIREKLAVQLIEEEAAKLGGSVRLLESGELGLLDKDGQGIANKGKNAFLTIKELADKAFADANMLMVNTTPKPQTATPTTGVAQTTDMRQLKYKQSFDESAQHFNTQ